MTNVIVNEEHPIKLEWYGMFCVRGGSREICDLKITSKRTTKKKKDIKPVALYKTQFPLLIFMCDRSTKCMENANTNKSNKSR